MGIIDPMAVTNVMATGVLEFGGAHTVWLALVGVMAAAAIAIAFSVANQVRDGLPALPRFPHAPRVPVGVARAK